MKLSFVLLMILIQDLVIFLHLHQFQNLVLEKLYILNQQQPSKKKDKNKNFNNYKIQFKTKLHNM